MFKIGDEVIFIDKTFSKSWEKGYKISLYKKVAIIEKIGFNNTNYLIKFNQQIRDTPYVSDNLWTHKGQILSLSSLKLKKFINKKV